MCGIVGILNSESLKSEAIEILKKLEYRGYDSAGISLFSKQKTKIYDITRDVRQLVVLANT